MHVRVEGWPLAVAEAGGVMRGSISVVLPAGITGRQLAALASLLTDLEGPGGSR
jgi:hypothetical protein